MKPTAHELESIPGVLAFLKGGNATFTLVSKKTRARYTYRARQPLSRRHGSNDPAYFVEQLVGPDNDVDYRYLGVITNGMSFRPTKKSPHPSTVSMDAIRWFTGKLRQGDDSVFEQVEFWHSGRCSVCNRRLTDPDSIKIGIGPKCLTRVNVIV